MKESTRSGWLMIGGLAAAVVLFFMLVFLPGMKRLGAIHEDLEQKRLVVRRDAQLQRSIDDLEAEATATRTYIAAWRGRMTAREDLGQLYGKLNELATAAGLTTTKFEPELAVSYQTFERVPVSLSVQGSAAAIDQLLASIERLPRLIWINEAKLLAASDTGETVRCDLKLAVFVDQVKVSD